MVGSLFALIVLMTLGMFASNGWLPRTDAFSGKKYGWFGRELPANAASTWDPLAAEPPPPQLSKEYIYAGSRLLAIEDANAQAAPPADLAVWRGSNGYWYVQGQQGSQATTFNWGVSNDVPVPGDYDGDGKTDFAIFRPGSGDWWVLYSSDWNYGAYQWGASTDKPAPADYNGDGRTDFGIYRPSTAQWFILHAGVGGTSVVQFGIAGSTDIPGSADFTGDGRADLGIYRPTDGSYHILDLATNQWAWYGLGVTGITCINNTPINCVVPSDYDGDGKADPAVYHSSTATWTIRYSATGVTTSTQWGGANDLPVQNDYDGDGKTDLATFKHDASPWARWLIRNSGDNNSTRTEYWGETGDIPVPAYYRR